MYVSAVQFQELRLPRQCQREVYYIKKGRIGRLTEFAEGSFTGGIEPSTVYPWFLVYSEDGEASRLLGRIGRRVPDQVAQPRGSAPPMGAF